MRNMGTNQFANVEVTTIYYSLLSSINHSYLLLAKLQGRHWVESRDGCRCMRQHQCTHTERYYLLLQQVMILWFSNDSNS